MRGPSPTPHPNGTRSPAHRPTDIHRHHPALALGLLIASLIGIAGHGAAAQEPPAFAPQPITLPPLVIAGRPARAHTQGLELVQDQFLVTARRDDRQPRTALLLRTHPRRSDWDAWDLTPDLPAAATTNSPLLDHPGGLQSDGTRLWIPLAESRRHGQSRLRAYRLSDLVPGTRPTPVVDIPIDDHVGALAVDFQRDLLLGANWDTESAYLWNLRGDRKQTWSSPELAARGVGLSPGDGIAVQDWKIVGDRLYAGGLAKASGASDKPGGRSRLVIVDHFLDPKPDARTFALPPVDGHELAAEAMAVAGDALYFLPGDLAATNRVFRVEPSQLQAPRSVRP